MAIERDLQAEFEATVRRYEAIQKRVIEAQAQVQLVDARDAELLTEAQQHGAASFAEAAALARTLREQNEQALKLVSDLIRSVESGEAGPEAPPAPPPAAGLPTSIEQALMLGSR